jgi:hypothetical protein
MILTLLLTLAATPDLNELKLDLRSQEYGVLGYLADGINGAPLSRYSTKFDVSTLDGEARAALTLQVLEQARAFLESPEGREKWQQRLKGGFEPVAVRSANLNSEFAYWTTLARERKVKSVEEAAAAERATQNLATFKKDRARLEREETTREKAAAQPDDAAFKAQVTERLTYFLAESKVIPFGAKLVEVNGKKRFEDKALEAKPKWWKFCFRAGPEATKAARDFATKWLAELNTPPSAAKLSDDK